MQEERPKIKLDERLLHSKSLPPCQGLPFFPDLHTEVSSSLNKPFSARIFSSNASHYANVMGLKQRSYGMPWVEEMLASYLSPWCGIIPQWVLPTKPVRTYLLSLCFGD